MSVVSIPVSVLRNVEDVVENPTWFNAFKPVTESDVLKAVQRKDWTSRHMRPLQYNVETTELDHVRRIAWMVMHPPEDPVVVNTNVPDIITDGYHRFYAAIIRGDEMIDVSIRGYDNYIINLFGKDIMDQIAKANVTGLEMQMC